ncbi:hypothetical protein GGH91_004457, partial [Coemansia sp. RSA 2671]
MLMTSDCGRLYTAMCLFCRAFGDSKDPSELPGHCMNWEGKQGPYFRTDSFTAHHNNKHGPKYSAYKDLETFEERMAFLDVPIPPPAAQTLPAADTDAVRSIPIASAIIHDLIGKLFYNGSEEDNKSWNSFLSLFKPVPDATDSQHTESATAEPQRTESTTAYLQRAKSATADLLRAVSAVADSQRTEPTAADSQRTESAAADLLQAMSAVADSQPTESTAADSQRTESAAADLLRAMSAIADLQRTKSAAADSQHTESAAASPEIPQFYAAYLAPDKTFELVALGIVLGCSFHVISRLVDGIKRIVDPTIHTICSSGVTNIARVIAAINLERIRLLLARPDAWAFSIALDGSSHQSKSYFDLRIRLFVNNRLENLHVLAIPVHKGHDGMTQANLVTQVLDVLCPEWRDRVIGISSDGARVMTSKERGVVAILASRIRHPVVFSWCGIHQLDLIAKKAMKGIFNGEFAALIKSNAAFLRRQQKLVANMHSKCPRQTPR